MARDNKVDMPMSSAGITRYFKESESKFHIKPVSVIIILVFLVLVILALHFWGNGLLGINI